MLKRYLLAPGPTPVPPEVLLAMARPMIHHRAPEFDPIFAEVREGLKWLFQTRNDVLMLASSGTGGMEGSISNFLSPGDKALCVNGGKFGERWGKICKAFGVQVTEIKVEWGHAVDPKVVADALKADPSIKAVYVQASETSTGLSHDVKALGEIEAYQITEKAKRHEYLDETLNLALEAFGTEEDLTRKNVKKIFEDLDRKLKRHWILEKRERIDGRGLRDIRPISCEVSILPRTHGSALFTRGETQVLAVVTFGTSEDEQKINSLMGETYKSFMLHYNFPPFTTGEVSPLRSPSRREIGHGALAERAILPVLPSSEKFPYTIRNVSEVVESNGSSSMATTSQPR